MAQGNTRHQSYLVGGVREMCGASGPGMTRRDRYGVSGTRRNPGATSPGPSIALPGHVGWALPPPWHARRHLDLRARGAMAHFVSPGKKFSGSD